MHTLLAAISAVIMSVGSLFTTPTPAPVQTLSPEIQQAIHDYVDKTMAAPVFGSVLPIAGATYNLAGSGLSQTGTSITLSSFTLKQTGQKILDADLSDTFYITLEPGSPTKQEIVSCTTVVQNSNDSATFSGCTRGLSPITPYTASTTLRFPHGGGTQVIFSNPPQFYNTFTNKENNETITGTWIFDNFPITPQNGTSSETVAGVVELGTAAETAASNRTGATTARTVIPTSLATSTYNAQTAVNVIPVTDSTGKIDTKFLGTTTVALQATTTIAGGLTVSQGILVTASTTNIASSTTSTFMSSTTPTTNWTKPSNLKYVRVRVIGGGGGGGGIAANGGGGAGSGGGGAYCEAIIPAAALGSTVAVTVGGSGIGSSGGAPSTPGPGGPSSFGTFCKSTGGLGGSISANGAGGAGGSATLGAILISGQYGAYGITSAANTANGSGGMSGLGYGFGGRNVNTDSDGQAGQQCGGGGSGGEADSSSAAAAGGAGAVGCVFVDEYYF